MQMCLTLKQTSEYICIYFTQPIQKVFVLMCKQMSKPPPALPRGSPQSSRISKKRQRIENNNNNNKLRTQRTETKSRQPCPGSRVSRVQLSLSLTVHHSHFHTHSLSLFLSPSICLCVSLSRQYKNGYVSEFIPCAAAVKFYTMRRSQQMDFFCALNFCSDCARFGLASKCVFFLLLCT